MPPERELTLAQQRELVAGLQNPQAYPHPVSALQVVETHISWVVLTGQFAYKIKKAVNLGFLDFSTIALRRHYCEEELRLNKRWAPELYIGSVAIGGTPERPLLNADDGDAVEYAVKMRQFPQEAQLDRQLIEGLLREEDLIRLAETVARSHESARVIAYADDTESVGKVSAPILENFLPVEKAIDMELLQEVQRWTAHTLKTMKPTLIARRKDGFVRECHGDLHLSNLVRLESGIAAFDCIEFSEDLRNIDVLSDIAFLVMDLVARARPDLAFAFLNRYLERSGDYAGMRVFGLYFVYHSMIRAKVAAIRSCERDDADDRDSDIDTVKHYLAVAVRWIRRRPPVLIGMHGLSGSGKTWLSGQLLTRIPAIRIRSDIERKRLFGLAETASSDSTAGGGIYSSRSNSRVYEKLFSEAQSLLKAGFNVILDAAFLRKSDRDRLATLATTHQVRYRLVSAVAPLQELQRRLAQRALCGKDPSEAGTAVLQHQVETAEQLDDEEGGDVILVPTDQDYDVDAIVRRIKS